MLLKHQPDNATIVGLRGILDLYCIDGVWMGRAWPRKAVYDRSVAEVGNQARLGAVAPMTGAISDELRAAYIELAAGGRGVTWVDMFRSVALGNSPWQVLIV